VWLHEKCEELNYIYLLDSIEINWDRDEISYFDGDGYWAECGEREIRLFCADLDREFPALETTTRGTVSLPASPEPPNRTGVAGRPTSKYLAEQEM
jgi:hypothetical protein